MKMRSLLSLIFIAALGTIAAAQPSGSQDELRLSIEQGKVQLEADGATFTPAELNALRTAIRARLADSPFRERGAIELRLHGEAVRDLKMRLVAVDLNSPKALARVLDDVAADYLARTPGPFGRSLTEPVKVVIGQAFTLAQNEPVASLVAIGSHGVVEGPLADLIAIGSDLSLGPGASVNRDLVSVGSRLSIDPEARIAAQQTSISLPDPAGFLAHWSKSDREARAGWGAQVTWAVATFLLSLGFGILLWRLFPRAHENALTRLSEQPWRALGFGVLHYLAIFPGAFLLAVTILGILFLPLYFLTVGAVLWASYVTSASWIGRSLMPTSQPWKQLAIGLLLLKAFGLVPGLGYLIAPSIAAFGLGAFAQGVYRMRRTPTPTDPASMAHAQPV